MPVRSTRARAAGGSWCDAGTTRAGDARGRVARSPIFALTDEAYALTAGQDPDGLTSGRILWTQFGLHASAAGALAACAPVVRAVTSEP